MPIRHLIFSAFCASVCWSGAAVATPYGCGELANAFGPFDYRTMETGNRTIVEMHHFTPEVEALRAGKEGYIGQDLDYTLRAMPNHPRALMAMVRYGQKTKKPQAPDARYSVECYLDRAARWAPDDPMVHIIYAIYLQPLKRTDDMRAQLQLAEQFRKDPTNADLDYNLGLLYADIGDYDRANAAAHRAYALGAPFMGLKNKLERAGKWRDDVAPVPPPSGAPGASAPATP